MSARAHCVVAGGAAILVSVLLAVPVWASEEAGETFLGISSLGWKVINFLLFFGLLAYLLVRPLQSFFASRRETIAKELEEAAHQREEARRLKADAEQRVASLQAEIANLRERLQLEGQRERESLIQLGETEAARLALQARAEADRRVAAASSQLAREAAETAAELARELLSRELTAEDRDRIFTRTLRRLEDGKGGAR